MSRETYLSIVDQISSKLKRQDDIEAILLFGGVSEGKTTKRSDIDIMVMVKEKRSYHMKCKFINGIWVEQYFNTYEGTKNAIEHKESTYVYMFKDSKILFDPRGKMAELKQIAIKIVKEYKPSEEELEKKRLEIQLFIDDLLDMYETGNLESAIFCMHDKQYIVLHTLFMTNNHFLPKYRDIYGEFRELTEKPANFGRLIRDIFFACESEKRLESFLELANWTIQQLGGRLKEIKR